MSMFPDDSTAPNWPVPFPSANYFTISRVSVINWQPLAANSWTGQRVSTVPFTNFHLKYLGSGLRWSLDRQLTQQQRPQTAFYGGLMTWSRSRYQPATAPVLAQEFPIHVGLRLTFIITHLMLSLADSDSCPPVLYASPDTFAPKWPH